MATNNKKFIILQEDDIGYGLNKKKPSGYTKIEPKNSKTKIIYYIQNLNNENVYSLNLIINNDSKLEVISIGEAKPDDSGKIDVSYDFDESLFDSLCGSSICLKDSKGDVKYPLSGFLPKRKSFNWKVNSMRNIKSRPFRKENFGFEKKKESKPSKNIVNEDKSKVSYDQESIKEVVENIMEDVKGTNTSHNEDVTTIEVREEALEERVSVENKPIELIEDEEVICEDVHEKENDEIIEESEKDEFKFNRGEFLMYRYRNLAHESLLRHNKDDHKHEEKHDKHKHENIYDKHEEKVKHEVESSKELLKEAKDHIESLKKLISHDDGKIEKLVKSLFSSVFKTQKEIEYDYNYRFFLNILSEFEELTSLNQDNYRFFKVYVDNFSQMENVRKIDNIKYGIVYYPMMFMYPYFRDKGYFIVGLNCDGGSVSNLVYGIEVDDSDDSKLPYDGKTGFNNYIYDYENSRVYNIMEYDYKEFRVK